MTQRQRLAPLLAFALGSIACFQEQEGPAGFAAMPVRSEVVATRSFRPSLELLGVVRPGATVELRTSVSGVVSYPARFAGGLRDGESVAAGEELAVIVNEQGRFALTEARIALEAAEIERDRKERGSSLGVVTGMERDHAALEHRKARERLESVERQSAEARLVAPVAGRLVVTGTPFASGSILAAGTEIGEIHPLDAPMRVEAHAPGSDRALLQSGQGVRVRRPGPAVAGGGSGAAGAADVEGRISEVGMVVEESGTIRVMADLPAEARYLPGEGVELVVELALAADAIVVPEEALVVGQGGYAVFTLRTAALAGSNRFVVTRKDVVLGGRGAGLVQVTGGLKAGDRIVVSGTAFIDHGSLVTDPSIGEAAATPASPGSPS